MSRSDITADDLHGLNLAWAIANVPGTAFVVVGGMIRAFVRSTGSTPLSAVEREAIIRLDASAARATGGEG